MTTENLKKALIDAISQEENKDVLELFLHILKVDSANRINKKQYNYELNRAMRRMDAGKYLTHTQVEKLLKSNI